MLSPSYISLSTGCAKPPGPFHGTVDLLLLLPTHLTSGASQDLEAAMTSIGATSVSEYELDQQAGGEPSARVCELSSFRFFGLSRFGSSPPASPAVLASALLDLGSAISQIEAVAAACTLGSCPSSSQTLLTSPAQSSTATRGSGVASRLPSNTRPANCSSTTPRARRRHGRVR